MAAIDKIYVSSWDEWKEIIDWAKETVYNGVTKFKVIDYCYNPDMSEEEIKEYLKESPEIAIMNTPQALDYFLIKHCPITTIQERLQEVYPADYIQEVLDGKSIYDLYQKPSPGHHCRVLRKPKWGWKPGKWLWGGKYRPGVWEVEVLGMKGYNEDYDRWIGWEELGWITQSGPVRTKTKSKKALIRKILSWELPAGSAIRITGRYVGETGMMLVIK